MGGRDLPVECEHGRVVDWGDFGELQNEQVVSPDDERQYPKCPQCEEARWPTPWATYRHYKGDLYVVVAVALMSNTAAEDEPAVVYMGAEKRQLRARTLNGADGWNTPTADGQRRFTPVEQ